MVKKDIKKGLKVYDRWFEDWGFGIIEIVKKTVVKIRFENAGLITFDYPHVQFLEIAKK